MDFFLLFVFRHTLNTNLLLILPVHKRILQILEATVFLAGDLCLQVSKGRHHHPSSLNAHNLYREHCGYISDQNYVSCDKIKVFED